MKYISDPPEKGKELIPVVIIQFHSMPDFWLHKEVYEMEGKFKGMLKYLSISISQVKKVHHLFKYESSFPTNEWEG
jgi:hypothetical protein